MEVGWLGTFRFDLTDEERQLCAWIAEQARMGVRRVRYQEAQGALGMYDETELTSILRGMRERLDDIHDMIQSPIVNTAAPYFDIHMNADYIWDSYCQAEAEASFPDYDAGGVQRAVVRC